MEVCCWLLPERNKWEIRRGWLRWASRTAAGKLLKLISPWFYLNMLVTETATHVLNLKQDFLLCKHSKFQWRKWANRFLEFDYILGRVQERLSSILLQFSCTELQYHIGVISWWQNCFVCSLFRFRPGVEPSPVPTWNIQSRPVFTANSAAA